MKINGLIHVNKTFVAVYIKGSTAPIKFDLEKNTIENFEKVDSEFLQQKLTESLKTVALKEVEFAMVLSNELLFTKTFVKPKSEEEAISLESDIQAFLKEIPFDEQNLKEKSEESGNSIISTATNINLFETLVEAMNGVGMKIYLVIPQIFLDPYIGLADIDVNSIDILNKSLIEIKKVNLLENEKTNKSPFKKLIIVLGIALIVFAGAWFAYLKLKNNTVEKQQPVQVEQNIVETPPKVEVREAPKATKAEITIQILNGTGKVGLANILKEDIAKLGYKKIDTGNAESFKEKDTVVTTSKDISEEYKNEIKTYLAKTFSSVKVVEESSESVNKSIKVVTGELLTK